MWGILHVLVKLPDTRFFIVGQGEWMDELKGTASELGFKREFVFTGFRDDVADFYQIADLFVMSSVQEGLGTAVLDSVGKAADEIVVVDSYSTDKTKEICNCLNVKFLQHAFEGHVEQKKYAVSCASYGHVL